MMGLFNDFKVKLYTQAIDYCKQSFSARMQIPGRGIAFVQRLDEVHAPMEAELRDGLVRIQQAYDSAMSHALDAMAIGGAAGGGFGALVYGIGLAIAGPGAWGFGALFGGVFCGAVGLFTAGLTTTTEASRKQLQSLEALFNREVVFVTANIPAINYQITNHPEDHGQLQPLTTHFNWVLTRVAEIEKECFANQMKEAKECNAYNQRQSELRQQYVTTHGPHSYNDAYIRYPNRIF